MNVMDVLKQEYHSFRELEEGIEQLESREGEMSLILTGKVLPAGLESYADHITYLQEVK